MKRYVLGFLSVLAVGVPLSPVQAASDLMVAAAMQRCSTNEECALVTQSCNDNCGFVPINKANMPALEGQYQQRCGKAMNANPVCNVNPPLKAACINARCTIDYGSTNNASAGDYTPGAYPITEQPVPSQVQGDYSHVDDRRDGFTAYSLPQNAVRQNTVGTITTRVYVPPSAPVSGGNYVPVAPAAAPAPVPAAQQSPAPAVVPPAAMPTAQSNATPPQAFPAPAVPATPATTAPAAGAPYEYVPEHTPPASAPAPSAAQSPRVIPSYGATGVPQAPPGSTPIPPSDLKPKPELVPPPGATVPANPEDPGAPPQATQEGADLMPVPTPDGNLALIQKPAPVVPAPATKSFAGLPAKVSKEIPALNQ